MLSVRELEVFRLVMELGTVTAAAEALHISQPAVSRTLQQAERRLGFPLFLRRKKRLLATPEGPVTVFGDGQGVRCLRCRPEARCRPQRGARGRAQYRGNFGVRKCVASGGRRNILQIAA